MIKKTFFIGILLLGILVISVNAQSTASGSASISLLNQNPDPARAGDIVELRFKVENVGGKDVNNIDLELMPEYPFSKVPGEEYVKVIDTLHSYQTGGNAEIIRFRIKIDKDAAEGVSQIKIKQGIGGSSAYSTNNFDVQITSLEFAQISIDKSKLDPGKETELTFTVTNTGNSPLQNLVFSWSEDDGVILPVYSDVTKYVKYVDIGQSVDLKYIVVADINANAGLYPLNLDIKYDTDSGVSSESVTKAGIFVGGETDFDVTFSESSAGQTSLSVANTGNNPALSVTVRIPDQQNFAVTGSTSSIVGNLDKGDYTIVSFQISQRMARGSFNASSFGSVSQEDRLRLRGQLMNASSEGFGQQNNLKVEIDYTDTTGVRRTLEKTVPIQFRDSAASSVSSGTSQFRGGNFGQRQSIWTNPRIVWPAAIILVMISSVLFYWKKKQIIAFIKRKKK